MSSILEYLDNNKVDKADLARQKSIAQGKMIPTRDTTDAIKYEGRGLKRWGGSQAALSTLGFKKTAYFKPSSAKKQKVLRRIRKVR